MLNFDLIHTILALLLAISELLPFIPGFKPNGLLDTIKTIIVWVYIKCNGTSTLARSIDELRTVAPTQPEQTVDIPATLEMKPQPSSAA